MLTAIKPKPFLKWAGGKGQLLNDLGPMVPRFTGRYFEPFIGGGALFFHLAPREATISDINPELINTYRTIQDNPEALIKDLQKHQNQPDYYYSVRAWDRLAGFSERTRIERASRFIYLNRTCFNGLYRENQKGQNNSPYGKYKNPRICDADNIRAVSEQLQGIEIRCLFFQGLLVGEGAPKQGDFVYFDPPYVPIDQASFTSYTSHGFDMEDQQALADMCKDLDSMGIKFMLSNSSALILKEMYKAFNIQTVFAKRNINSKGSNRGKVPEIIVKNF